jgi:branched-subunit amino acid ABC-type transport system permease component
MDATTTFDLIEIWMILSALFIAGSVAAMVGALIERWIIRPIGKRRGWYE